MSQKQSKELEFEVKAVGVRYSEADGLPVGLILDNGFTLGFTDRNGNPLPLNPEAIEKWRNRCNENARGN